MFGSVLIIAATIMQLYVFWRAASVPTVSRLVPRGALVAAGVLSWALLPAGRFAGHGGGGTAATLELAGLSWLAALLIATACLLAVDLAACLGLCFRRSAPVRRAPVWRGWALLAAGVLSLLAFLQGSRPPVIDRYEVILADLPPGLDGTVVVALSDLHLGSLLGEEWMAARVEQVRGERPDLVVLLGDLVEGHGGDPHRLLAPLGALSAPLGVWAVTGNHESHGNTGGADTDLPLEEEGVRVLHDRWQQLATGLVLAGVDYRRDGGRMAKALAGRPPGAVILLSHFPLRAEEAARAGAGLMLSGHTHGGQVWPFSWLAYLRYPVVEGLYRAGGMTAIISRGTGTWGPRMRLWRPSQILRVTLRSAAVNPA
jgi:predicted MPP superfamily phosphohydrolase